MRDFTTSLSIQKPIGVLRESMLVNNILADISQKFLTRMMEGV